MTVKVYQSELDLGIGELVAKGSIAFASAIKPSEVKLTSAELAERFKAIASANPNQLDLYCKHSILASVGWNKNDDVFTKGPTWAARNTVADKQLNLGHNELDIVGHMTNSYVLDAKGNIISDDTPIDKVPDMFDVVSEFVLYKMWANEDRLDEIKKVIADIEAGNGYVSMECRFPAFDYAIIDKDGNHKTVARDENSAFLSQHLRAFGGTGEYQGYRIGRLLQDFFFTGQGIVTHPANERSIIFDTGTKPFSSKASIIIRDTRMDEKQIQALVAELAAAKARLDAYDAAKAAEVAAANEQAKKTLAEVTAAKTALEGEVTVAKASVATKDTAIATLTEELKTAKEAATIAKAEADSLKATAIKVARATKLANAGVAADKIEAEVTKWASLSDEQFDSIVAMFPPKKDDDDDAKKKAKADADAAKAKVEADLAKAALEGGSATLNTGGGDTPDRTNVLGSFLVASLPYSAKAAARIEKEKSGK